MATPLLALLTEIGARMNTELTADRVSVPPLLQLVKLELAVLGRVRLPP